MNTNKEKIAEWAKQSVLAYLEKQDETTHFDDDVVAENEECYVRITGDYIVNYGYDSGTFYAPPSCDISSVEYDLDVKVFDDDGECLAKFNLKQK